MRKALFPLLYGLLLTVFTVYVALDSFVLTRVYGAVSEDRANESVVRPTTEPADISARAYEDANIRLTITESREYDTDMYIADVTLSSPTLLKTALAQGLFGRNVTQTTSEMAAGHDAILAINGDFYGSRERGYVMRDGVIYRESSMGYDALAIMADGRFRIVREGETALSDLAEEGAVDVFSFGPALVVDGEIAVTAADEVGRAMEDNPRTAIGLYAPGHYVLLVSDGRTRQSTGLTLLQLAGIMQELGVQTAYTLDGGGSSTMVFMGEVINQPTTNGRRITERSVSDIVYIGY